MKANIVDYKYVNYRKNAFYNYEKDINDILKFKSYIFKEKLIFIKGVKKFEKVDAL